MKKVLMIVIIINITALILSLIGCGVAYGYNNIKEKYESTEPINTNKTTATTQVNETFQISSTTVDTYEQSKINDCKTKFEEAKKYVTDLDNSIVEIDKDINYLLSINTNDKRDTIFNMQEIKYKYEEAMNNLRVIYVPEIFRDHHSYLLDYYTAGKQWASYMVSAYSDLSNNQLLSNSDHSNIESLNDEAINAKGKASQEFDRVLKNLFDEAEELGIVLE